MCTAPPGGTPSQLGYNRIAEALCMGENNLSLTHGGRAEGNPLEIACMLHFEKNVEPAKCLGVDEIVLVGRILADRIGIHIERA